MSGAAMALDRHGHLCESTGNISFQQTYAYNAHTLKLVQTLDGASFPAIVADRSGYLYASTGGPRIYVFAPGCTLKVNIIHRCASITRELVFDQSGNLYSGNSGGWICVYAPTQRPGHMKFLRKINVGADPVALAVGPDEELFAANEVNKKKGNFVSVFPSGGSAPVRRITAGLANPETLTVDSKGWLYVANIEFTNPPTGWVSVYAPGGKRPLRTLKYGQHIPMALTADSSDNVYVGSSNGASGNVYVYSPGGVKLLRKITKGIGFAAQAVLIGSP